MILGYFLSSTVTERIHLLKGAAEKLAGGDLQTRVPVNGRDEVAALSNTFNQMAEQLQLADQKQRELESLRRDLIAWVGHDLQTPLASMRAILEALSDGVVDEPEMVKRYLLTAQRDVMSLSALIDDLFQMSQLDAGGFPLQSAPASLSDLVSDTLESFSAMYPAAERYLLLGADVLATFAQWREPERVLQLARLVVLEREGDHPAALPPGVEANTLLRLPTRRVDVSSTEIRQRVRAGKPIRGFVTDGVAAFIDRDGLYR